MLYFLHLILINGIWSSDFPKKSGRRAALLLCLCHLINGIWSSDFTLCLFTVIKKGRIECHIFFTLFNKWNFEF